MKIRRYFSYAFVALTMVFVQSCDLETSDNGDLDGMWQMESVDTLATGGHLDMHNTGRIWCFQGKLAELRQAGIAKYSWDAQPLMCKFQREDNTLTMGDFIVSDRAPVDNSEPDPKVDDVELLKPYGINALEESFRIEKLNSSTMVLESTLLRLNLRKY